MIIRAHILERRPNWIIAEAANGTDAIALIDQDLPDYCTMDINMPGISGSDAAEIILAKYPALRMVLFSANIQGASQQRASVLGITFVSKPVTEKSIAQTLAHFEGAQ